MNEQPEIRRVGAGDIAALQDISRHTFRETFAGINTEENMAAYIHDNLNTDKLTEEIMNPGSSFYFVLSDGKPVGFLKVNLGEAQTELKYENGFEIERIYVLKSFQGYKLGQLLFNKAVELAREANAEYLWLGVWENNTRAIEFYARNGMIAFDKHIFRLGNDDQTDIMMKLDLTKPA